MYAKYFTAILPTSYRYYYSYVSSTENRDGKALAGVVTT